MLGWITKYLKAGREGANPWGIPVANLGEVVKGKLYRSAAPSVQAVPLLIRNFQIRTVVDLRDEISPQRGQVIQRWLRDGYGLHYARIAISDREPMPQWAIDRWLQIVENPRLWPILVHCAGGRHRTGAAVAIYRQEAERWSAERAYQEALDYDFYTLGGHGPLKDTIMQYRPTWARGNT